MMMIISLTETSDWCEENLEQMVIYSTDVYDAHWELDRCAVFRIRVTSILAIYAQREKETDVRNEKLLSKL